MRTMFACLAAVLLSTATAAAQSADGKAVYDKSCASCHGADGKGNAAKEKMFKLEAGATNLGRDAVASQTRDEKKAIIAEGKAKMPGYAKKMTPAEVDAVTDHAMKLIAAIRGK